ncbi:MULTISPECIES: ABC transporter permease [Rathayibacter]|uniref:ABC transporter permease n=2 Tax=Rathayibacter festucae TaxID=110937 RepID=A0A3Q9V2L3_9MICO|nr:MULTISPECIES: ABC transporter permease [Rathayibacter]AZZ54056.1 ABC transporter permease [Rathayibacter festucae DSM 15932]MCJ1698992.1 ABC transporter permease [Rathayibacter festucae]QHC63996.1 FtsX-like permease family protein [Rathayibacter festucae]ROQ15738.1 putative ABC transport system permease protein [Rathayibacter sp. PhB93]TDQ15677.1 putative ABC transport system permease protein [Rathayibacter sp. PhB1]
MGGLTGVVGAIVEAWTELRIHRGRVLLSLIGVAVAVAALTGVVAAGGIARQANIEVSERSGGRPASLYISAYTTGPEGVVDPVVMQNAWEKVLERYRIDYASRTTYGGTRVQFTDGAVDVGITAVDQPYAEMHRVELTSGSWFVEGDERRLAPALVINEVFWDRLGRPDLRTHPTATLLGGEHDTTAVVIGVTPSNQYDTSPSAMMLVDAYSAVAPEADPAFGGPQLPNYEMWVPLEIADPLIEAVKRDVTAALGPGFEADVYRQDYLSYDSDPFAVLTWVIGGVAGLVLALGALGLLNIALVTVRQRIREIGIRRSFGASSGRIFFSIMMESVVATVVAGVVGVTIAVILVTNPWTVALVKENGISDIPPFPVEAALLGLGAATLVGALAGLVPAIVAVRVKVIDAIRY